MHLLVCWRNSEDILCVSVCILQHQIFLDVNKLLLKAPCSFVSIFAIGTKVLLVITYIGLHVLSLGLYSPSLSPSLLRLLLAFRLITASCHI